MGDKKQLLIFLFLMFLLVLTSLQIYSFSIDATFLAQNDPPVFRRPINLSKAIVNHTYFALILADDPDLPMDYLNFSSNLSFINFHTYESTFNPAKGVIDFTPNDNQVGTYFINITVSDRYNEKDSEIVQLRITYNNNPPVITASYPTQSNITISEGDSQNFNVSYYDPDNDPITVLWYLDSYLRHQLADSYTYSPSYEEAGLHNLTVIVTDGIESVRRQWNITVLDATPPPQEQSSSSTSGSSSSSGCKEKWLCTPWPECPEYGIQTRECRDMNNCGTVYDKPVEKQNCIYIPPASCYDSILNQNEIMIDCGGICPPCPTCSDGIQNQNEEGIDCGGPCSRICGDIFGMPIFPLCGDNVCQGIDIFFCVQDCKSSLLLLLIFLVALFAYFIYNFKNLRTLIAILKYRRETLKMLQKRELPGIEAIKTLTYLEENIDKLNKKDIALQFAKTVKTFFSVFFLIKYQFTFEELDQELKKSKIQKQTIDQISRIFQKISLVEYSRYDIKRLEFLNIIKLTKSTILELISLEEMKIKGFTRPPENPILRFFFNLKQSLITLDYAIKKTKEHQKKENDLFNLIKRIQISLNNKDYAKSKELYDELSNIYSSLSLKAKKRYHKKIIKLFEQIKDLKLKYSKKILTDIDLENLKIYINRQLALSFKDYEIKKDLLSKGWTKEQINLAFDKLKKIKV